MQLDHWDFRLMKRNLFAAFFILFFISTVGRVAAHAEACALGSGSSPWANLLCPSRAIDWSQAGLPAILPDGETTANPWTPPTRPACTSAQAGITVPVPAGTSSSTITTAMASCKAANPAGSYLLLGAGAFTISSGTSLNSSYVTLRGSGPMSTTVTLTSTLTVGANGSIGGGTLNASPSEGTSSVTVTNVSGAAPVAGYMAWFNQCDSGFRGSAQPTRGYNNCPSGSITDNGYVFVCGGSTILQYEWPGSGSGCQTSQKQTVTLTSVTNNGGGSYTLGFTPAIALTNWSTSNAAALYWSATSSGIGVGLEDMTIRDTGGSINLVGYGNWIKGIRFIGTGTLAIGGNVGGDHNLLSNNYFFGATPSSMTSNTFLTTVWNSGQTLILNNAGEQGLFLEGHGSTDSLVIAYNYAKTVSTNYSQATNYQHDNSDSGVSFVLNEGNQVNTIDDDNTWGTGNLNTFFRNWPSCGSEPYVFAGGGLGNGISIDSFHRFDNVIANALAGGNECTTYTGPGPNYTWIRVNHGAGDALTGQSLMLWANYDAVNGAALCQSSEVPTNLSGAAAPLSNPLPTTPTVCGGSATIPASFYMNSITAHPSGGTGLSWWKVCTSWTTFPTSCASYTTNPFPSAGPDVSGGPYANGYAYANPALLAWNTLPIDTTLQNSYNITGSSWSGGTETLTVSGLPSGNQVFGPLQISGGSCATSRAGTSTGAEVQMTASTSIDCKIRTGFQPRHLHRNNALA